MSDNYDPEYLSELDREAEFINSSGSKRYATRFQLKEPGESALIRFIPYRFDSRGRWFARVARHWINNRPYICTKETDEAHGGNQRCEICDLLAEFNKSKNREVSYAAYRMMAVPQWATQLIVFETYDRRGRATKNPDPYLAQEFWLYKEPFSDILTMFKNNLRKKPNQHLSILDPEFGCDVLVTKAKRGYRFEREDSAPISKTPHETLERILKGINFEVENALSGEDLDNLLVKIEDICDGRSVRDDRRGESRNRDLDLDEEEDSRESSRRDSDRRESSRDSDRRSSYREESRSSRRDDSPARGRAESSRDIDDRRSSRSSDLDERGRDRDLGSRRSERDSLDDRRETRDDRRRLSSRDEDLDEPREERRSSRRDDPVDDRAEPRSRREDPPEPVSRNRRDSVDGRVSSRFSRDDDDVDIDGPSSDESDDERDAPPPISRGRSLPPPPAAGRGTPPPPASRAAQEPKDDDDVDLPDGDKDSAPPEEPKPGEIISSEEKESQPAPKREFQSQLSSSLASRIRKHQSRDS